jgi:hypothetical protein
MAGGSWCTIMGAELSVNPKEINVWIALLGPVIAGLGKLWRTSVKKALAAEVLRLENEALRQDLAELRMEKHS